MNIFSENRKKSIGNIKINILSYPAKCQGHGRMEQEKEAALQLKTQKKIYKF